MNANSSSSTPDFYQVLEITPDASLIDVKKAYRRLALLHHPDRNNGSQESSEKFKLVSEAYQVLSDANRRAEYDASRRLKNSYYNGSFSTSSGQHVSAPAVGQTRRSSNYYYVDPFAQFDDLFRNDAFFHEAFREMDDVFAQRFKDDDDNKNNNRIATTTRASSRPSKRREGWFPWLLRQCGIDFHMTTYTSTGDGGVTQSSYSATQSGDRTYTDKKRKVYIDQQGRRVTVQSMEKDGNRIEEKYINQELVERKVNGLVEVNRFHALSKK